MRFSRSFERGIGIQLSLICTVVLAAGACSEAAGSGDTRLVIDVSQDEIAIENRTGTPLVKGEVSLIPQGTAPRPYVAILPHLSNGERRTFALSSFRNPDGTRFMRGVANGRRVKVTAKDLGGQTYEREVPFK